MFNKFTVIYIAATYLVQLSHGIPDYFHFCARSDPNLKNCMIESGTKIIKGLINGEKSFKLPPLDPFIIQEVEMKTSSNFLMRFKNFKISGIKNMVIEDVDMNFDTLTMTVKHLFPELPSEMDYTMDGKLLFVPINGEGRGSIKFTNMDNILILEFALIKRDGKDYLDIKNSSLNYKAESIAYHFDNLFNGDKTLGNEINKFLNENHQDIDKETQPVVLETFRKIITSLVAAVVGEIPYEVLFKP